MATIRWYLVDALNADGWQDLSTTAQGAATIVGGWVVGTGSTFSSEWHNTATDRASSTFTANTVPDGTLDTTLKDAFRTPILSGTFASGNWTFQFAVVSTVQAGAADGQIVFRLIKANADGSSPTEITSAQQSASVMTNVGATDINGTLTFNPGAITLANQYLFVQVAWKRTGAGGMTTTNIRLRTGVSSSVGTTILSSDFVPTIPVPNIPSGSRAFKPRIAGIPTLRQIIFGHAPTAVSTNPYNGIMGGTGAWSATETNHQVPWPCSGVFRNLVLEIGAAASFTLNYALRINGVSTALNVTIDPATSLTSVSTAEVEVNAGDLVSLYYTFSGGTPANTAARWALEFESITPQESGYGQAIGASANDASPRQTGAFAFHPTGAAGTAHLPQQVVAVAGTVTKLYVRATSNPGASAGMTWYFNVNGVRQDGSGGTVNTACAVINTTQASSSFSLSITPGDLVMVEGVSTGTFSSVNWAVAHNFLAADPRHSVLGGSTGNITQLTQATPPIQKNIAPIANNTSFAQRSGTHTTIPVTFKGLRVYHQTAPGVGHFRTVELWAGLIRGTQGSTTGLTTTVTDTETTKSDLTHEYTTATAAPPDQLNMRYEEDGTAAGSFVSWGFAQINPTTPASLPGDLILGVVIGPGCAVYVPTVAIAGGAQAVTGTTIGVGSTANAPSLASVIAGQTIYSTARVFYTETLLFEFTSGVGSVAQSQSGRNGSQTISGHSGVLTSVSLRVRINNSPTDAMYLVVRDSTFNGTILDTSVQIAASSLSSSFQWVNFSLLSGVVLTAGTTYWIQVYLTRAAVDSTNNWQVERASGSSGYAGGDGFDFTGSSTGNDYVFRLYTGTSHTVIADQGVSGQTISSTARIQTQLFEFVSTPAFTEQTTNGRGNSQTISGHAGVLTSVELLVKKGGNPTDAMYLEIRDDFDGTVLATSLSVPASALSTTYAWMVFALPSGITLSAGTTYWIEIYLTRSSPDGSNYWIVQASPGNGYAGGAAQTAGGTPVSGWDLNFRLDTGTIHTVEVVQAIADATIPSGSSAFAPSVSLIALDQGITGATIAGTGLPAPIAYWPLNENSGTTSADVATGTHGLTLVGGTWNTALKKYGASALANNGSTRGASFTPINLGTSHSIAFWINGWDGSDDGVIIGGAATFYGCYLDSTDLYYSAGTSNYQSELHGGLTGSHQIVITRVGPFLAFYKDGVQLGLGGALSSDTPQTLGSLAGYDDGSVGFAGVIDDVRFYDVTLNDSQVAALYALDPDIALGGATLTAPTVALSGGGDQAITGATLATASALTAPSVAPGAVTIVEGTIPVGSSVFAPSATPGAVTIVAGTVSVGSSVFAPSVAPGAVTIIEGTIPAGSSVFAPSATPGAVTIVVATISAGSSVFAPSAAPGAVTLTAGTIPAGSSVFAPSTTPGAVTIVEGTIPAGSSVQPPTVVPGAVTITGPTVAIPASPFAPSVTQGAVTVGGASIATTATPFTATIAVGAVDVVAVTIPAASLARPPTVVIEYAIGEATIPSAATVGAPTVAVDAVTVGGATILAASDATPPTVGVDAATILAATISSTTTLLEPLVTQGAVGLVGGTCASTAQTFEVSLTVGDVTVETATIASAAVLVAPTVTPGAVTVTAGTIGAPVGGRRLYLPSSGSPGLGSLGYTGGWNKTSQAARFTGQRAPSNTASVSRIVTSSLTTPEFHCAAQFQYPGLAVQTISGTLKGQIRANVNNVSFNGTIAVAARVVSSTGTLRGHLVGVPPAAPTPTATPPELTITTTNRSFRDSAGSAAITLASVTTQLNDVLVIEIGARDEDTGTSRSTNLFFQDLIAAADLPENQTSTGGLNPWVEFSSYLLFSDEAPLGGAVLFSPELSQVAADSITTAFIDSTTTVSPPSVVGGLAVIDGATIAATSDAFAPSVAVGDATVLGATVPPTSAVFAPAITVADITVGGETIAAGSTVTPPSVTTSTTITLVLIASTADTFAPSVQLALALVTTGTIPSGATVTAPSLASTVTGATIGPDAVVQAPSVAQALSLPAIPSTATITPPTLAAGIVMGVTIGPSALVSAPTITVGLLVALPTIDSTATLLPPSVLGSFSGSGSVIIGGPTIHAVGTNDSIQPPSIGTGRPIGRPRPPEPEPEPLVPIVGRGGVRIAGPRIRATGLVLLPTPVVVPAPAPEDVAPIPALVGRATVVVAAGTLVARGTWTRVERLAPRVPRAVGHGATRIRWSGVRGTGTVEVPPPPVAATPVVDRTRQLLLDDEEFLLLHEAL